MFSGMQLSDGMTLEDVGLQNTTTIHCVHSDQAENYSLNNVSLDDVNLSAVDSTYHTKPENTLLCVL